MKNRCEKENLDSETEGAEIRVEKKKIKNLYLRMGPADGEIRISAPP